MVFTVTLEIVRRSDRPVGTMTQFMSFSRMTVPGNVHAHLHIANTRDQAGLQPPLGDCALGPCRPSSTWYRAVVWDRILGRTVS